MTKLPCLFGRSSVSFLLKSTWTSDDGKYFSEPSANFAANAFLISISCSGSIDKPGSGVCVEGVAVSVESVDALDTGEERRFSPSLTGSSSLPITPLIVGTAGHQGREIETNQTKVPSID